MSNILQPSGPFRRILFCAGFSEGADPAFAVALAIAKQNPGSQLFLLHVIPETDAEFWKSYLYEVDNVDEQARRVMDEKMARAYLDRVPPGLAVKPLYRVGRDHLEILEAARELAADLILINRDGGGLLHRALFGKTAEKVVRHAECPVLVVPMAQNAGPGVC